MIINFSIQNFGPIKEKQTLSFEANKSNHLEDSYIIHVGKLRLLKIALIYGANASGKTTILKALNFFRDLVLEPVSLKNYEFDFQPFLFDPETPKQNTILSIEFLQNETKYYYEVVFSRKAIISEVLNFYKPNKANIFKRKTDIDNELTEIEFGSKIRIDKHTEKSLEANTLWNNTVLGGFLKTNVDINELKEAVDWFENYLQPLISTRTKLEGLVTSRVDTGEISKQDIIRILQKADFQISDIIIQENEKMMPKGIIDFLKTKLNNSANEVKFIEESGNIKAVNIEFVHTINQEKYILPLELESQGTRRYYGFAGLLALLIENSNAFSIDELESSLHPDLYKHFILSFLLNTSHSQIIATTHNRELLDNKEIFRNDAIWFTEKNENCATELYSLSDFDTSVIRDTSNVFNAYKIGKLGGVPNLHDYYIELVDEK